MLVVEDFAVHTRLLRLMLELNQYDVRTAPDAQAALEIMRSFTPQLIVMDVQLPGMSGFDLARKLKTDPETRSIPILAVTALQQPDDEARVHAAGCDGYLTKPLSAEEFIGAVVSHIGSEARPANAVC